jgi:diguanylate cyclase (GGDEF)-like protein
MTNKPIKPSASVPKLKSFQRTLTLIIWAAAVLPALFLSFTQFRTTYIDRMELRSQELAYGTRITALESKTLLQRGLYDLEKLASDGNIIRSATFDILSVRSIGQMQQYLAEHPTFSSIMMIDEDLFQTEVFPIEALTMDISGFSDLLLSSFAQNSSFINPAPRMMVLPYHQVNKDAEPDERYVLGFSRPILKPRDSITRPFEVVSVLFVLTDMEALIKDSLAQLGLALEDQTIEVWVGDTRVYSSFPDELGKNFLSHSEILTFGTDNPNVEIKVGLDNRINFGVVELFTAYKSQLFILVTTIFGLFALATFIISRLVRPVILLRDMTQQLTDQDFSKPAPSLKPQNHVFREFSEVSQLLENMALKLGRQVNEMHSSNHELQKTTQALEISVSSQHDQNEILNSLAQYALVIQNENNLQLIGELTLDIFSRINGGHVGLVIYRNRALKGFHSLDEAPMSFLVKLNSYNNAYLNEEDLEALNEAQSEFTALPIFVEDKFGGFVVVDQKEKSHFQLHAVTMFVTVLQSTLEQLMLTQKLEKLANSDALTDLYNRHYFDEKLEEAKGKYEGSGKVTHYSILIVDINELKKVNDNIGHVAGDELIKHVAGILMDCTRNSDVIARTGGDEFLLLLDECDSSYASHLSDRIRDRSGKEVIHAEGHDISVAFSLGSASTNVDDVNQLIEIADARMYREKESFYKQKQAHSVT